MLRICQEKGWVPAIQFISVTEEDRPLGFLALRLLLNEKCFVEGVGILAIQFDRGTEPGLWAGATASGPYRGERAGLDFALITCDEENEASRRTILANGIYDNTIQNEALLDKLDGEVAWTIPNPKNGKAGAESRGEIIAIRLLTVDGEGVRNSLYNQWLYVSLWGLL